MAQREITGSMFCGHEVSQYGQQMGYVDYRTLAQAFDCVMNNYVMQATEQAGLGCWEIEHGEIDEDTEIYQYYIIDESGVDTLTYWTDEIIFYNDELDMYLWGVRHFGTPWNGVLTDIKINPQALEDFNTLKH